MSNLKTLGIIILDEIGYALIMNSLTLNILFNNEQLKNFKVGYNLIKIDNEDKLLNNLQKFKKNYCNEHIIYFELNSIFKNRKKDNESLPKENKKIIFLYKDVDIINLFVGDWIPYGVIRNENLFYELNEFGIGGMFPANGYLGCVKILYNRKISFNAWEQNNSEFIFWLEFEENNYVLLREVFKNLSKKSKLELYEELTKI